MGTQANIQEYLESADFNDTIKAIKNPQGHHLASFNGVATDAAADYAPGCIAIDDSNGEVYVNTGTNTSAAWKRLLGGRAKITAKTASYTCVEADSGTHFTTTGAAAGVTFTLPAVALTGWQAWFHNTADQSLTVASAAGDDMVLLNDLTADSLALSTATELIGGGVWVISDGTRWVTQALQVSEAQTFTVAT